MTWRWAPMERMADTHDRAHYLGHALGVIRTHTCLEVSRLPDGVGLLLLVPDILRQWSAAPALVDLVAEMVPTVRGPIVDTAPVWSGDASRYLLHGMTAPWEGDRVRVQYVLEMGQRDHAEWGVWDEGYPGLDGHPEMRALLAHIPYASSASSVPSP